MGQAAADLERRRRTPSDLWLWHHAPPGAPFDPGLLRKTCLRCFDLEHTFRLIKGALGWTTPQIRTPAQGEALTLGETDPPGPAADTPPGPPRFPILRRHLGTPASIPKPATAGPGRPPGTTRPPRTRHPVGKKNAAPTRKKGRNSEKPAYESTATVK